MLSGLLLLSFALANTDANSGVNGTVVDPELKSEFGVMGRFATSASCPNIFKTRRYECAWACSGEASGSELINFCEDDVTTGVGMVVKNDKLKAIFITFRGSDKIRDWLLNGYFRLSEADFEAKVPRFSIPNFRRPKKARIHAGFELQYVRLRDRVLNDTLTAATENPDYQIIFVGHSLGAAVTVLAAVDFFQNYGYGDRISLFTFGSPRVGNKQWAKYVDELPFAPRIYRIQRRGDPFHYLPPRWAGYQHSDQMYLVLDDKSIVKCKNEPGSSESPSCMKKVGLDPLKHLQYFGKPRCGMAPKILRL